MVGVGQSGPVVVAGAGDVGGRLAARLAAAGTDVLALRRRPPEHSPGGVRALAVDLVSGQGLAALPRQAAALVFCAAPDQRDETAYRALAGDPDIELRSEARFRLALMLADRMGRVRDAAVELRRILDERPDAARVRLELARMDAMLGRLGAAERENTGERGCGFMAGL